MKKLVLALVLFSLGLPRVLAAEVVDRVVAIVGGEMITLSDVKGYSAQKSLSKAYGMNGKDPLESLIHDTLLKQEMERLAINASGEDLNNALREVAARNKVSTDALKSELAKKGLSFEKYKEDLSNQIRQMKFMGQVIYPRIKISEEEIAQRAGAKASQSEEGRFRARMEILQSRVPDEMGKYLDELRAKSYVEIKK